MSIKFVYKPPDGHMKFEELFPENLRLDKAEKNDILEISHSVWMFVDGSLVGECYGFNLAAWEIDNPGDQIEGTSEYNPAETIYCYSNGVLIQNRHYGTILKSHWLGYISRVFEMVVGHARPGGSQVLNARFGAEFVRDWPNWYETGETYKQYEIRIQK